MLSFARFCFVVLSVSLLFNVSLAANLQYSVYNGTTTCSGSASFSGTDNSPNYTSSNGLNTWSGSCVGVSSGVTNIQSAKFTCTAGSTSITAAVFYSDTACATQSATAVGGTGSGSCVALTGSTYPDSVSVTCNSAFAMAALSLPLMALLALAAMVSM